MHRSGLALILLLAACASPAPEFAFGATETRHTHDGIRYAVFQKGARAEAIRLDRIPANRHRDMPAALVTVMEQVTGCKIKPRSLAGDSAEIRASLTCP